MDDQFLSAVRRWTNLNYLRVMLFVGLSIWLVLVWQRVRQMQPSPLINQTCQHMEQRLSVITIGVDDLALQRAFYTERLEWKPVAENKDIVFFRLNGLLFSLFHRKALAQGSGINDTGSGFRSLTLSQNVPHKSQVDELYETLKGRGVKILTPPSPTPFGGYYFTFADAESNVLEVAYNPYTPLDEAGNVRTHLSIDDL